MLGSGVARVAGEAARVVGRENVGDVGGGRLVVVGTERDLPGLTVGLTIVVDADGNPLRIQKFSLQSKTHKTDIVLVIDNSDSMIDEARKVRKNIGKFMADVGSQTDIKLALISAGRAGSFVRVIFHSCFGAFIFGTGSRNSL